MPWRLLARALLLAAFTAALTATIGRAATAATGLSLNLTPNPIASGESVLAYGRLSGAGASRATIVLHERINPASGFTREASTTTDVGGFYEFVLPAGAVSTNRSWYVSALGGRASSTVHERVAAGLTLEASAVSGNTSDPLSFTGRLAPAGVHTGEEVSLQEAATASGSNWKTVGEGALDASSSYSISHTFHQAGAYDLRAVFAGDSQNTEAWSDPVTVVVEQAEQPAFTIEASNPAIDAGQTVTISGVLRAPSPTSTPLAGETVSLWGHAHGATYASIDSTTTGSDGSYSFTQTPPHNGSYEVRAATRRTAQLYEAVHAVVTLKVGSTGSKVGQSVTFSGSVSPNEAGELIELEQMGSGGHFHTVQSSELDGSSSYSFTLRLGSPGAQSFRVLSPGSDTNASGISAPVSLKVTLPPVETLPALCGVCVNRIPLPSPAPPTTTTKAGTIVTVTAGGPMTYSFTLSALGQSIFSYQAKQLSIPAGVVTFKVTNPLGIGSHDFFLCSTPLTAAAIKSATINLPQTCTGTGTPSLKPGDSATLTVDLGEGTYEYLSTVGCPAFCDSGDGMIGKLKVT